MRALYLIAVLPLVLYARGTDGLTCYDCSHNCEHLIRSGRAGKCSPGKGGKCFIRTDPNAAQYHGCVDEKKWPNLDFSYTGCRLQKYAWGDHAIMWCFCDDSRCNADFETLYDEDRSGPPPDLVIPPPGPTSGYRGPSSGSKSVKSSGKSSGPQRGRRPGRRREGGDSSQEIRSGEKEGGDSADAGGKKTKGGSKGKGGDKEGGSGVDVEGGKGGDGGDRDVDKRGDGEGGTDDANGKRGTRKDAGKEDERERGGDDDDDDDNSGINGLALGRGLGGFVPVRSNGGQGTSGGHGSRGSSGGSKGPSVSAGGRGSGSSGSSGSSGGEGRGRKRYRPSGGPGGGQHGGAHGLTGVGSSGTDANAGSGTGGGAVGGGGAAGDGSKATPRGVSGPRHRSVTGSLSGTGGQGSATGDASGGAVGSAVQSGVLDTRAFAAEGRAGTNPGIATEGGLVGSAGKGPGFLDAVTGVSEGSASGAQGTQILAGGEINLGDHAAGIAVEGKVSGDAGQQLVGETAGIGMGNVVESVIGFQPPAARGQPGEVGAEVLGGGLHIVPPEQPVDLGGRTLAGESAFMAGAAIDPGLHVGAANIQHTAEQAGPPVQHLPMVGSGTSHGEVPLDLKYAGSYSEVPAGQQGIDFALMSGQAGIDGMMVGSGIGGMDSNMISVPGGKGNNVIGHPVTPRTKRPPTTRPPTLEYDFNTIVSGQDHGAKQIGEAKGTAAAGSEAHYNIVSNSEASVTINQQTSPEGTTGATGTQSMRGGNTRGYQVRVKGPRVLVKNGVSTDGAQDRLSRSGYSFPHTSTHVVHSSGTHPSSTSADTAMDRLVRSGYIFTQAGGDRGSSARPGSFLTRGAHGTKSRTVGSSATVHVNVDPQGRVTYRHNGMEAGRHGAGTRGHAAHGADHTTDTGSRGSTYVQHRTKGVTTISRTIQAGGSTASAGVTLDMGTPGGIPHGQHGIRSGISSAASGTHSAATGSESGLSRSSVSRHRMQSRYSSSLSGSLRPAYSSRQQYHTTTGTTKASAGHTSVRSGASRKIDSGDSTKVYGTTRTHRNETQGGVSMGLGGLRGVHSSASVGVSIKGDGTVSVLTDRRQDRPGHSTTAGMRSLGSEGIRVRGSGSRGGARGHGTSHSTSMKGVTRTGIRPGSSSAREHATPHSTSTKGVTRTGIIPGSRGMGVTSGSDTRGNRGSGMSTRGTGLGDTTRTGMRGTSGTVGTTGTAGTSLKARGDSAGRRGTTTLTARDGATGSSSFGGSRGMGTDRTITHGMTGTRAAGRAAGTGVGITGTSGAAGGRAEMGVDIRSSSGAAQREGTGEYKGIHGTSTTGSGGMTVGAGATGVSSSGTGSGVDISGRAGTAAGGSMGMSSGIGGTSGVAGLGARGRVTTSTGTGYGMRGSMGISGVKQTGIRVGVTGGASLEAGGSTGTKAAMGISGATGAGGAIGVGGATGNGAAMGVGGNTGVGGSVGVGGSTGGSGSTAGIGVSGATGAAGTTIIEGAAVGADARAAHAADTTLVSGAEVGGLTSKAAGHMTNAIDNRILTCTSLSCEHTCKQDSKGVPACSCPEGYVLRADGRTCKDINECDNANGFCHQECVNTRGSFYCTCFDGYQPSSDEMTCIDIDECSTSDLNDCSHECVNTVGSYKCLCPAGFHLDEDKTTCLDFNECREMTDTKCEQKCINTAGSYECGCKKGWQLNADGRTCDDADECKLGISECDHECVNTLGSFTCQCTHGFYLASNGRTCHDSNECVNSKHNCSQKCINKGGGYVCGCFEGYTLNVDDITCDDINECRKNNGGCNQTCSNTKGSYKCGCHVGFQLDANEKNCRDTNECLEDNGGCQHRCHNVLGSYRCSCSTGYQMNVDQRSCDAVDVCSVDNGDCDHVCVTTTSGHKCSCRQGYMLGLDGRSCIDINECNTNNGGCSQKCINKVGSYKCKCRDGYQLNVDGRTCDDIDECVLGSHTCKHDCINTAGSYECGCNAGYSLQSDGESCGDINECTMSNGGCDHVCTNTIGSYQCSCRGDLYQLLPPGKCVATCPGDFIRGTGLSSCYKIFSANNEARTQPNAEKHCESLHPKSRLISVESKREHNFIGSQLRKERQMLEGWQGWWTNGFYHSGLGQYQWRNNGQEIAPNSTNWGFKKHPYLRTCVWVLQVSFFNHTWGNYDCNTLSGHICEIDLQS